MGILKFQSHNIYNLHWLHPLWSRNDLWWSYPLLTFHPVFVLKEIYGCWVPYFGPKSQNIFVQCIPICTHIELLVESFHLHVFLRQTNPKTPWNRIQSPLISHENPLNPIKSPINCWLRLSHPSAPTQDRAWAKDDLRTRLALLDDFSAVTWPWKSQIFMYIYS